MVNFLFFVQSSLAVFLDVLLYKERVIAFLQFSSLSSPIVLFHEFYIVILLTFTSFSLHGVSCSLLMRQSTPTNLFLLACFIFL